MKRPQILQDELKQLNARWDAITAERKEWMDKHMADFAEYQIGEELFDLDSGRSLGTVCGFYRYCGDQDDPRFDREMDVDYKLDLGGNGFDNTSRLSVRYGNRAEYEKMLRSKLKRLEEAK